MMETAETLEAVQPTVDEAHLPPAPAAAIPRAPERVLMPRATRAALSFLALTGLGVGVWALLAPADFYAHFPGLGRTWVALDGPYNEHLVRDVGAANLAFGVLAGVGLRWSSRVAPAAVGWATLCYNAPHAAYHLLHLGVYGPLDQVLNVVTLLTALGCSLWLALPPGRAHRSRP